MTEPHANWAGKCLCGAVRYSVSGAPIAETLCYCTVCQTIAGGSPSGLVAARRDEFHFGQGEDELQAFTMISDAGNEITRRFCRTCGTHLSSELPSKPDRIFIKAGTLDTRDSFHPKVAIFAASAQPWHQPQFTDALATFDRAFVVQETK